jgi:hypothetical protein
VGPARNEGTCRLTATVAAILRFRTTFSFTPPADPGRELAEPIQFLAEPIQFRARGVRGLGEGGEAVEQKSQFIADRVLGSWHRAPAVPGQSSSMLRSAAASRMRLAAIHHSPASLVMVSPNIDGVQQLLVDIVAAGANEIQGVSFDVIDKLGLRAEARRDAVAAARRKAQLYAEAAGAPTKAAPCPSRPPGNSATIDRHGDLVVAQQPGGGTTSAPARRPESGRRGAR